MREVVAEMTKMHTEIRTEIAKSHLEAESRSEIRSAKNHVEIMNVLKALKLNNSAEKVVNDGQEEQSEQSEQKE